VYQITLRLPDGQEQTVPCRDDEPILEAAEAKGLALPYSCRSAACATCAGKVIGGKVELEDQYILGDTDLAAGYTLLCSAVPRSNCTILTHQQKNVEGV
jgi:ferredoxin